MGTPHVFPNRAIPTEIDWRRFHKPLAAFFQTMPSSCPNIFSQSPAAFARHNRALQLTEPSEDRLHFEADPSGVRGYATLPTNPKAPGTSRQRRDCRRAVPLRFPLSPGGSVRFMPTPSGARRQLHRTSARRRPALLSYLCSPDTALRCSQHIWHRSPSSVPCARGARIR